MISSATDTMSARDVYARARFNMVESQIRTNRVTDSRLLAAMAEIPRQLFVPDALAGVAYVDKSLRIQPDRYLLEPLVLARLLQEAMVEPNPSLFRGEQQIVRGNLAVVAGRENQTSSFHGFLYSRCRYLRAAL